jgi:glycosyltransferase involved in cell wall biosynthesis
MSKLAGNGNNEIGLKLTAIILTFNEAKHLERCIKSLDGVAGEVVVVDCYSNDTTVDIAYAAGARVLQNRWVNYATQFNWALTHLGPEVDWVLRIDADEFLTLELQAEIRALLPRVEADVDGVYCGRNMFFQGKLIEYGGVFPIRVLRLFRNGRGHCENRWMDEHIKVEGATINFGSCLIDHNLNSLNWWITKHNGYASREAVDLLNLEYRFMTHETVANLLGGKQTGVKRWLKEVVYARLPLGIRSFVYFFYRYVLRMGFLDGYAGTAFHFLQGFWYRYLVDAKIAEVKRYMKEHCVGVEDAIKNVLDIEVKYTQESPPPEVVE